MTEQNEIADIQQKINAAGTDFERSAWQTKLAWHFAERERWLEAGREFHKASAIALAASQSDRDAMLVAAQLCRLEGLAWANGENHRPEAMRALEQALLLYENLADSDAVADVQSHLDSLSGSGWQEQQLADSLDEALKHVLHESDALLKELSAEKIGVRIPLLRTQALVHGLNGDGVAAKRALVKALELAQGVGDKKLAVELEAELALLPNLQTSDVVIPEKIWQQLVERAAEHGATSTRSTLLLEQATQDFAEGLFDDVVSKARQVRLLSLERFGPKQLMDYFSASMMLASAHERRGDDVDVIDTLLRCKTTLERELGKSAGEPLKEMLDALPVKWGEVRFNQALRGYRQMMRGAGGHS